MTGPASVLLGVFAAIAFKIWLASSGEHIPGKPDELDAEYYVYGNPRESRRRYKAALKAWQLERRAKAMAVSRKVQPSVRS